MDQAGSVWRTKQGPLEYHNAGPSGIKEKMYPGAFPVPKVCSARPLGV